jgi:hypothetical protein
LHVVIYTTKYQGAKKDKYLIICLRDNVKENKAFAE